VAAGGLMSYGTEARAPGHHFARATFSYFDYSERGYRVTDNQQIHFHIAFGLDHNAPTYIFAIDTRFGLIDR
jgi:hypothetical protein